VILINLLPHREAARKRRREVFYAGLGASAFAGAVIAGAVWLWYGAQISAQEERNRALQTEITRLEGQIKDIATLQDEIAATCRCTCSTSWRACCPTASISRA
jgi:type IV pilus assembly protein PilN